MGRGDPIKLTELELVGNRFSRIHACGEQT